MRSSSSTASSSSGSTGCPHHVQNGLTEKLPVNSSLGKWGDDLCRGFIELLPVTGASITVIDKLAHRSSVCASDSVAAQLERLQFDLGEGPQWAVMKTGIAALRSDLSPQHSADWPMFAAAATECGAGAVFTFPLRLGSAVVGVVDLYRRAPGVLDQQSIALASTLANEVAWRAVQAAIRSANQEGGSETAGTPTMRREVHQATGMILAQLETTATNAFALLRAHAFLSGKSVDDVAKDVVGRGLDFRYLPN
jgi:hypothetical protein